MKVQVGTSWSGAVAAVNGALPSEWTFTLWVGIAAKVTVLQHFWWRGSAMCRNAEALEGSMRASRTVNLTAI